MKQFYSPLMRIFILFIFSCSTLIAHSQSITPGGIFETIFDADGGRYPIRDLGVNDTGTTPKHGVMDGIIAVPTSYCSPGYFRLFVEVGSGMDSFATSSTHLARLNVMCQVLNDLHNLIKSPCDTTGQKVNIVVRNISNTSTFSGVLAVASPFIYAPLISPATGIIDGMPWITIHNGKDAYKNVISPVLSASGSTYLHALIAFDFNSFSWNTNLLSGPASGAYDMYTVAMHECLHILGFASLIDSNGLARLNNPSLYRYYYRYDQFLKSNGGTHLIQNAPGYSCNPMLHDTCVATSAMLKPNPSHCQVDTTNCSSAIIYDDGTYSIPVFTPNCWSPPSSLSHLEDMCLSPAQNNEYFVMSNATNPGGSTNPYKHYPKPEEHKILCDIGYNLSGSYGSSAVLNSTYTYANGACNGGEVGGMNDGIDSLGHYLFIVTGGTAFTLHPNDLLANDHKADSFACLEVVDGYGPGTLSATSGSSASNTAFTYTPSSTASGIQLLRYIPVNIATGKFGNITYVYVFVNNPNCIISVCDMVGNGGFESSQNCGSSAFSIPAPKINCWTSLVNGYVLFADNNCSAPYTIPFTGLNLSNISVHPGSSGNHYVVGMVGDYNIQQNAYTTGAIQTTMGSNLVNGTDYTLDYWAYMDMPLQYSNPATMISFCVSQGPMTLSANSLYPLPGSVTQLADTAVANDFNWHHYQQTFTYTGTSGWHNLIVCNAANLNPSSYDTASWHEYLYVDDISLKPANPLNFYPPDTITTCDTVHNLGQYVGATGGTFSGTGVVFSGGVYNFYPTLTGPGSQTVTFNDTDSYGCTWHINKHIWVKCCNTSGLAVSVSRDTVCAGTADTLFATGATNYSWAPPSSVNCATCATTITHPTSTTTFTDTSIIYGCTYLASHTIIVNPLPGANITSSGSTALCAGVSDTLTAHPGPSGYSYSWLPGVSTAATLIVNTANTYKVKVTNTITGCFDTSAGTVITINPVATVNPVSNQTVCNGTSTSAITFSGPVTGTIFNWTNNTTSIGLAASGTGNIASFTATNSGTSPVTATITIIPIVNGCQGTHLTFTITVNPNPTITAVSSQTLCNGANTSAVSFSGAVSGTIFSWANNTSSIGLAASGTGNIASFTAINTGSSPVTATITDTASYTNNGVTCKSGPGSFTITVNPSPSTFINHPGNDTLCTGASIVLNGGTGTSYQWQRNGSNITGATGASYNASYIGNPADVYRLLVTGSNGCTAFTPSATVSFVAQLSASIGSNGPVVCFGDSIYFYSYGYSSATALQWLDNGSLITGATHDTYTSGVSGNFRLVLKSGNFCFDTTSAIAVTVLPQITASMSPSLHTDTVCYGSTDTFYAYPRGSAYQYKWEINTGSGYVDISSSAVSYAENDSNLVIVAYPGTYRVIVRNLLDTLCESTSDTVRLTVLDPTLACPCSAFNGGFHTISGSIFAANNFVSGNKYYIKNDVTLTGTATVKNVYISVAAGKTVYIDDSANIVFDSSHIFSGCGSGWNGIVLNYGATQSAHLFITNHTLIEDANVALYIDSAKGSTAVFGVDNSIFNKNYIGINIENDTLTDPGVHYTIKGTVFTSREGIAVNYKKWASPAQLKSAILNNGYTVPFYIDSAYLPSNSTHWGIELYQIGNPAVSYNNDLQIGDNTATTNNQNQNLFDNLAFGINSSQGNISCVNNAFIKCNNDGIFAQCFIPNSNFPYGPGAFYGSLKVWKHGGAYNNRFYDCHTGVEACGVYAVLCQDNYMVSSHTTATLPDSAAQNFGYNIYGDQYSSAMDTVDVSYDTIVNISYGIVLKTIMAGQAVGNYLPGATIHHNEIRATIPGKPYDPSLHPNRYVRYGIQALNVLANLNSPPTQVRIDNNRCMDVHNGILASSLQRQIVTSNQNNIVLAHDSLLNLTSDVEHQIQYGIWHTNCVEDSIYDNPNIHGFDILNNNYADSVRAFYVSHSSPVITCNYEDSVGRGFEFSGPCSASQWLNDSMSNNRKGLVLNNKGVMGQQGSFGFATGNRWGGTWTPGSDYWTYCLGFSNPQYSKLFVNNTSITLPTSPYNGTNLIPTDTTAYDNALGSILTTNGGAISCPVRLPHSNTLLAHENIALGNVNYGTSNSAISAWIGQYQLWQAMQVDSSLALNSTILQQFQVMAAGSRYAYMSAVENYIANRDFTNALNLLAACPPANPQYNSITGVVIADSSGAAHVIANYRRFYKILIHYLDGSISSGEKDSLKILANLCPATNGTVIYQARTLHALVFNTVAAFNDENCTPHAARSKQSGNGTGIAPGLSTLGSLSKNQQFFLSPNPNNGRFVLSQKVADTNPVKAEIWDSEGKNVYRGQLFFVSGAIQLNMNGLKNGLYLLHLQDNEGNSFVMKFLIVQ